MITDSSVIQSCRCGFRLVVAFIFSALAAVAPAQDISSTYLKGPYLQAPGADTMTIMWESSTNKPGIVRYGLGGVLDRALRLEIPRALLAVTNFSVTNITDEAKTKKATTRREPKRQLPMMDESIIMNLILARKYPADKIKVQPS